MTLIMTHTTRKPEEMRIITSSGESGEIAESLVMSSGERELAKLSNYYFNREGRNKKFIKSKEKDMGGEGWWRGI